MKKIAGNIFLLTLLMVVLYGGVCVWYARNFKTVDFKDQLGASSADNPVEILILGTSHSMAMDRLGLEETVTVLNIGSAGMGIYPGLTKIDYARTHVQVKRIVFVCDAFQFAPQRNEFCNTFETARWDPELWAAMRRRPYSRIVHARYIFGVAGNLPKIVYAHAFSKQDVSADEEMRRRIRNGGASFAEHKDQEAFAATRIRSLFVGLEMERVPEYLDALIEAAETLKSEGVEFHLVTPPLPAVSADHLPEEHHLILTMVEKRCREKAISFTDYTGAFPDPANTDADHLNGVGLEDFSKRLLEDLAIDPGTE